MPCSPARTSIGSPGTRCSRIKLRNVTPMKVGMISVTRLSRNRSIFSEWAPLFQVDGAEVMTPERAHRIAGDGGAHRQIHDRVRDQVVGCLAVHDHLRVLIELGARRLAAERGRL